MRDVYTETLDTLASNLSDMSRMAEKAMVDATRALLTADIVLAEQTIEYREEMDILAVEWEHGAFGFLALQAPVAHDLRRVVSGINIVADLQRMGGLAVHIAELARRRHPAHVLPPEVEGVFEQMGRVAVAQAETTQRVLETGDAELAADLRIQDQEMDALHRSLFMLTSAPDWPHGVPAAVDITLLGRFYERYSDHTVEVAKRVIFLVTGDRLTDES